MVNEHTGVDRLWVMINLKMARHLSFCVLPIQMQQMNSERGIWETSEKEEKQWQVQW